MRKRKKCCALFLLRFIMLCVCVCVCVCVSPKSGETIRGEPDLFNEPRGNAKFMCFHLCRVKPGAQTKRRRWEEPVIYTFAEAGTLAATGHPDPLVHFLGRSGYFQWGKTQASDLFLGALIKGLS